MDTLNLDNAHLLPRNCLVKVQSVYPVLKRAERKAADFMLANPEVLTDHTIVEISDLSGCSETTWFRLAKRLGYSGYHDMKSALHDHFSGGEHQGSAKQSLYVEIDEHSSARDTARAVFESTISALHDTFEIMDEAQYAAAVDALLHAESILLCGVGDAYSVVRSAHQKLFRAGFRVYESADQDVQLIALSHMKPGDVVIAISYSGKTRNVLDLVKYARSQGITVISITNYPVSPLCKNSDIVLLTAAFASQVSGEIVSKRATQMCIIESLYINLLLRTQRDTQQALARSNQAIEQNKL